VTERQLPPALDDPDVYRALVEGIPAIVYVDALDELSTNFYTSPQAVDLLGFTQEEWSSRPDLWIEQIHPDDREAVLEENRRSNIAGDRFFAEYRFRAKDGRIVWIRDEALVVRDGDGTPLYWRGVMTDVTPQKEAEEKLRWSLEVLRRANQQRRQLMERLERAQEEERRRIAADLHDDSIQELSAIDIRLQTLAMQGGADPGTLVELHGSVSETIEKLRHLLFELRPSALDREGLARVLRVYLDHLSSETGIAVDLDADGLVTEPPPSVRATLFRLTQEALANVRKHAAASRATVTISTLGAGVSLRVADDGTGFDPAAAPRPGHIGLPTVTERAELAGGWCRVSSAPGAGTTVELWLPIRPASDDGI
jgi:PAS domain S-box-containing protein